MAADESISEDILNSAHSYFHVMMKVEYLKKKVWLSVPHDCINPYPANVDNMAGSYQC